MGVWEPCLGCWVHQPCLPCYCCSSPVHRFWLSCPHRSVAASWLWVPLQPSCLGPQQLLFCPQSAYLRRHQRRGYEVQAHCRPKNKACHDFWLAVARREQTVRDVDGATWPPQASNTALETARLRVKEYDTIRSRCPVVDIMNSWRAMLLHNGVVLFAEPE